MSSTVETEIRPFQVEISDEVLEGLRRRITGHQLARERRLSRINPRARRSPTTAGAAAEHIAEELSGLRGCQSTLSPTPAHASSWAAAIKHRRI
jgi:hypothetical protein